MTQLKRWTVGWIAAALLWTLPAWTAENADEGAVKAAYLVKIPKFVDWPERALGEADATFTVCVLGDEEVNGIAATLEGQKVKERMVSVVNGKRGALDDCRAVYVAASESLRVTAILAEVKGKPILTIGDAPDFAARGGMVGLVRQDARLKFEVNLKSANQAGLRISAQFAQLATKAYQ
jgi:hypothetical protein